MLIVCRNLIWWVFNLIPVDNTQCVDWGRGTEIVINGRMCFFTIMSHQPQRLHAPPEFDSQNATKVLLLFCFHFKLCVCVWCYVLESQVCWWVMTIKLYYAGFNQICLFMRRPWKQQMLKILCFVCVCVLVFSA